MWRQLGSRVGFLRSPGYLFWLPLGTLRRRTPRRSSGVLCCNRRGTVGATCSVAGLTTGRGADLDSHSDKRGARVPRGTPLQHLLTAWEPGTSPTRRQEWHCLTGSTPSPCPHQLAGSLAHAPQTHPLNGSQVCLIVGRRVCGRAVWEPHAGVQGRVVGMHVCFGNMPGPTLRQACMAGDLTAAAWQAFLATVVTLGVRSIGQYLTRVPSSTAPAASQRARTCRVW